MLSHKRFPGRFAFLSNATAVNQNTHSGQSAPYYRTYVPPLV